MSILELILEDDTAATVALIVGALWAAKHFLGLSIPYFQ